MVFADESTVSPPTTEMGMPEFFRRVVERLAYCCIQETGRTHRNENQGGRGWPRTHCRILHETSADSFNFWSLSANMRRWQRRSGVSLRHRSGCLERYPAATKRPWTLQTKTGCPVRLFSPPRSWALKENPFASWYEEWPGFLLLWSSAINAHVAPG